MSQIFTADMELVEKAKSGDRLAQNLLCQEFTPLIRASVFRYVGQRAEWDDLIQCGFEHFLHAVAEFDETQGLHFAHFVRLRVRAGILTQVRRQDRIRARTTTAKAPDEDHPLLVLDTLPDITALSSFQTVEWKGMLDRLTARERTAIEYTVLRDWTAGELADLCQVGRETVKTWRKRGLKKLRTALQEDNPSFFT